MIKKLKCTGNIMFSVISMERVHSLEYFKKVFFLFKNSLHESNFRILCPQVLTVAGMAVLEITHIPFCLIFKRYHFTLPFSPCVEETFTVPQYMGSFFLYRNFSAEEKMLFRLLGRRVFNSGTCK